MANNNDGQIVLGLDIPKTVSQINSDIKKLQNQLKQVKATSGLDTSSTVKQINAQIAALQSQLQKINIQANFDTNNAQKTGQKIGQTVADSAQRTIDSKNVNVDKLNEDVKNLANNLNNFSSKNAGFDKLMQVWKKFDGWGFATKTMMTLVNQLQKMPQKVRELDDAVTDFTMATGTNKAQVSELVNTYADLGDELSATVTDVTISATEWLKQGKSIAETETLIKDAMILSKIGKLSSADSTKYLTSVMKSYKVAAEDTLGVVDKLSAVDMASATDVGDLAEGISTIANNARLAGVSMDKLLGYLAAVGEVSQEDMSSVGTAYNAIFARMGNIKSSKLKDYETGEDLSNVETVLKGVGIQLRDSQNGFRDFDEVLDETASRWTSFSEVQQRAIANAFAGTHYVDSFITLMENYDNALKYSEVSMSSSGQAMEKFAAYEDSIAGHTEKLENAFIQLSNTFLDSEFLKGIIDLGTIGVKAVDGLANALTPLGTIGLGAGITEFVKNFA